MPLEVNVALPAAGDAGLPLIVVSHGCGGRKLGFADLRPWAARGYAALAISARGFEGRRHRARAHGRRGADPDLPGRRRQ